MCHSSHQEVGTFFCFLEVFSSSLFPRIALSLLETDLIHDLIHFGQVSFAGCIQELTEEPSGDPTARSTRRVVVRRFFKR